MKTELRNSLLLTLILVLVIPALLHADPGNQYCITPPFISAGVKPNLLLLLDNSASMYDLAYDDKGKKHCAINTTKDCTNDSTVCTASDGVCGDGSKHCSLTPTKDCTNNPAVCTISDGVCAGGKHCSLTPTKDCTSDPKVCTFADGVCTAFDRVARYCYDETYSSANIYVGYFDRFQSDGTTTQYYSYDFTNKVFIPESAITTDVNTGFTITCNNTGNNRSISGQLCLVIDASKKVKTFNASGNYLNWLTASKFDVEKQALTGGKHVTKVCANDQTIACNVDGDCNLYGTNYGSCSAVANLTPFMMLESRGCVGQEYIKDANTGDFVNYNETGASSVPSLGVTFTVTGPKNKYNISALSPGGQTYLTIYEGASGTSFNYYACQQAVQAIQTGGNSDIKQWVDACLATTDKPGYCDKSTGTNKVATWSGGSLACAGTPDCVRDTTMPQTSSVCSLGTNISCTSDANCSLPAGNFCTLQPTRTCTGATDTTSCKVTTPAATGKCTASLLSYCKVGTSGASCQTPVKAADVKQINDTCPNDASCSNWKGAPTDWVAQTGACTGASAAVTNDYGPCIHQNAAIYGTCVSNDLSPCVLPSGQAAAKNNAVFMQSMQECWTIRQTMAKTKQTIADAPPPNFTLSNMNTVKQMCPDVYASWKSCSNNTLLQCSANSDCLGTNTDGTAATCLSGPAAIGPGNPAYLCGLNYAGQCFTGSGTSWTLKGGSPACQDFPNQSDYATVDIWKQNSLAYQEWNFCNNASTTTPQVIDPSNPPSDTVAAGNLPAILSGISVIAQLGGPLATVPVRISKATAPTSLVQEFSDQIRMGVMSFNQFGSSTESASASIGVRKVCSNDSRIVCTSPLDCGGGTTKCDPPSGAKADMDGAKILYYVGQGTCSLAGTMCSTSAQCLSGEKCVNPGVGDHSSGLITTIDSIRASTWTPFSEAFYDSIGYFAQDPLDTSGKSSRTALRLNNADFSGTMNPSEAVCQSNNILLVTDGSSTADQNSSISNALGTGIADVYKASVPGQVVGTCPSYAGSMNLEAMTWLGHNRNIKTLSTSTASTAAPAKSSESVTTYIVFNGSDDGNTGDCNNTTLLTKAATNGGTSLLSASRPDLYKDALRQTFQQVAAKAASGTAASILSNSEGSGANILQAVFYPKKIFANGSITTEVNWIGEMQNLWYFVDPYIQNSTIREDTDPRDLELWLNKDYVVRFSFDNASDKTLVQRYFDSNGDGIVTDSDKVLKADGTPEGLIDPDYVRSIWRAGMRLWARSDASNPRIIYTGYNSSFGSTPAQFSSASLASDSTAWDLLQIPGTTQVPGITNTQRQTLATNLISYVRGTDQANDSAPCLNLDCKYRNRTVTIGVCSGDNQKQCKTAADCPSGNTCGSASGVWKLGDIISSTPRVQSTVRLNTYDLPSPGGYSDQTYQTYIGSKDYAKRGMVYVGANDGMLHAFNLGILDVKASGFKKASLTTSLEAPILGAEQWAFIPKTVLPYLKYFSDASYSHLYYVDGRTVVFDASIGYTNVGTSCVKNSYWLCDKPRNGSISMVDSSNNLDPAKNLWRTVVIGSMGMGGATRDATDASCTEGASGNCIKTPVAGTGLSSYFALDVTDPNNPKYLWEFSNSLLGNALSAPAIVRVGDKDKNGRWFAVFGNGPFGPIDQGTHQFKAQSNQNLRFFVVDLLTGDLLATLNDTNALGISNAFAGSMLGGAIDADRRDTSKAGNYSDDAIYAGYVRMCAAGDTGCTVGTWTNGGVVRIMTKENQDPTQWVVSKVIDGIGPVTTSIARTQDTKNRNLWLYFGTGRFYFRDSTGLDDNDTRRALFGLREPCYNTTTVPGNVLDPNCTATVGSSSIVNQTTLISTLSSSNMGWTIDLDPFTTAKVCSVNTTTACFVDADCASLTPALQTCVKYGAERVVTDTVALINGTVFYTSFKPTMDICGYGGNSFLWGVKYDTGGQAAANALTGKALIQLSTGEFREVDLSSAFTDKGGRRMASPMTGKPPSDAPPIVSSSQNKPLKKILHIQEH